MKRMFAGFLLLLSAAQAYAEEAASREARSYFGPTAYKMNYFTGQWGDADPSEGNHTYLKFQFSLKQTLWPWGDGGASGLFFGYTQKSFWNMERRSLPFKESNYNPEVFAYHHAPQTLLGAQLKPWRLGIEHESNGRSVDYDSTGAPRTTSRSWNRFYWQPELAYAGTDGSYCWLALKAWGVLDGKSGIEDNPDIRDYYGNGELMIGHSSGGIELLVRGRSGRTGGSVETNISYKHPSWPVTIFFQAWNGYGEGLIDYNHYTNRYALGFSLSPLIPCADNLPETQNRGCTVK